MCELKLRKLSPDFVLDPSQQQFNGQSPYPPPNPGFQQQPYQGFQPQQPYNPAYPHQMPQNYPTQPPYQDPEDPDAKGFDFNDDSIRKGFIRKVYSILTTQLLVTFGLVALFVFHEPTKRFVNQHHELFWISLVVLVVTMIALVCCESVRRNSPMNFIFLALFTLAQSFLLGCTSARYDADIVMMAVGITAAVCFGLTIFAFQTKWDFTVMGGEFKGAVCCSIVFIIFFLSLLRSAFCRRNYSACVWNYRNDFPRKNNQACLCVFWSFAVLHLSGL